MSASAAAVKRVLVHLKKSPSSSAVLANFTDSVVDCLKCNSSEDDKSKPNELLVSCELKDNRLILCQHDCSASTNPILLKRPSFCPISALKTSPDITLPDDILSRGINVGVVAVLETADQHILVTRRAAHMRTFPGVWVPPGGGIDLNESLINTALRELNEETGLEVNSEKDNNDFWSVLCLWESVYPPMLAMGDPKRHHIVVYLHIKAKSSSDILQKGMKLDPEEVDAAAWLSVKQVDLVVNGIKNETEPKNEIENTFRMCAIIDGKQEIVDCPVEVLLAKAPKEGMDVERISTGTRFAMSQWLKTRSGGKKSKM